MLNWLVVGLTPHSCQATESEQTLKHKRSKGNDSIWKSTQVTAFLACIAECLVTWWRKMLTELRLEVWVNRLYALVEWVGVLLDRALHLPVKAQSLIFNRRLIFWDRDLGMCPVPTSTCREACHCRSRRHGWECRIGWLQVFTKGDVLTHTVRAFQKNFQF